ncbi:MAG TPA: hypothetical protein V6C81_04145 [Planktothrix sp.]|jgi:predicted DNA-binding transcriptional regulator YafY
MDKEEKTRLERLVAIEERISNNKFPTMRSLCHAFSVRPRTIYADIRLLRERFGIDIRFDRFRNGYFNASPGKRIPIGDLVEDDHVLLLMGCAMLASSLGDKVSKALGPIQTSMVKRLPFGVDEEELQHLFVRQGTNTTRVDPGVFSHLCRALLENRTVELHIDGGSIHVWAPCFLAENDGGWLLVGLNTNTLAVESHALEKIKHCTVREEHGQTSRKELMADYFKGKS